MATQNSIPQPYGYIYLIRNLVNGKVYVGQTTTSIRSRWKGHCKAQNTPAQPICRAIRKYGQEFFSIAEIAQAFSQEELDRKEEEMVSLHDSLVGKRGYNIRLGGKGGGRLSVSTREKLSALNLGRPAPNKGRRMSEGQRSVMRAYWDANRGLDRSDAEDKALMSAASVRFWSSAENRAKQREIVTSRWADQEFKQRMAAQRRIVCATPKARANNRAAQMNPRVRKRKSEATKEQWQNPAFAAAKSIDAARQWSDPESRRKMVASFNTPEASAKKSAANLRRWALARAQGKNKI